MRDTLCGLESASKKKLMNCPGDGLLNLDHCRRGGGFITIRYEPIRLIVSAIMEVRLCICGNR